VSTAPVRILIAVGALFVFGSVNYSIYAKERIKAEGEVVYLELAPVDPRSLMQGDYMALRFTVARAVRENAAVRSIPLQLDERRVASVAVPASTASLHIRYRLRSGDVWVGTNAYFFEEGTAEQFTGAKYGKFHVDRESGEAVLVALCDENLRELGTARP
jgi:uncharacterized membrane-anchored protein